MVPGSVHCARENAAEFLSHEFKDLLALLRLSFKGITISQTTCPPHVHQDQLNGVAERATPSMLELIRVNNYHDCQQHAHIFLPRAAVSRLPSPCVCAIPCGYPFVSASL